MIETLLQQISDSGWLFAALRLAFIGLLYLFLFLVLRTTARELHAAALNMGGGDTQLHRAALVVIDGAESSLLAGEAFSLDRRAAPSSSMIPTFPPGTHNSASSMASGGCATWEAATARC
jgi:hypothetical protein